MRLVVINVSAAVPAPQQLATHTTCHPSYQQILTSHLLNQYGANNVYPAFVSIIYRLSPRAEISPALLTSLIMDKQNINQTTKPEVRNVS